MPVLVAAAHGAGPATALADEAALRWINTLRYSAALRLEGVNAAALADPNADDSERNFRSGFVSNRADLVSQLNLDFDAVGAELSGAAWLDTLYLRRTGNDSPATLNTLSRGPDRFAAGVRARHGRRAELLTGFVHGRGKIGGVPAALRIGRSHLQWGESLFFADNGIAAGQTPIDAVKALSIPGSRAKEVFMPVAQAWAGLQPRPGLALEAYYQFEWRKTRLPGAGSYFSTADFIDAGGERLIVGPGQFFRRGRDRAAPASGQYGAAVRLDGGDADLGLYVLRYHAKEPQVYLRLGPFLGPGRATTSAAARPEREGAALYGVSPGVFVPGPGNSLRISYALYGDPRSGEVGSYDLAYPEGIAIYGLSASGYAGSATVAGEVSLRRRMPLVSNPLILFFGMAGDGNAAARYAVGRTLHVQLSAVAVMPETRLWHGASLAAEIAANRRLKVTRNPAALDTGRNRTAVALRATFEPQYFSVLPGLDLRFPMGFGLGVAGRSSVLQGQNARAGDMELGVRATYRAVWTASLRLTHFVGPRARQPLKDRDVISLSLTRAF
jgi:hypothetical protein